MLHSYSFRKTNRYLLVCCFSLTEEGHSLAAHQTRTVLLTPHCILLFLATQRAQRTEIQNLRAGTASLLVASFLIPSPTFFPPIPQKTKKGESRVLPQALTSSAVGIGIPCFFMYIQSSFRGQHSHKCWHFAAAFGNRKKGIDKDYME